MTGSLGEKRNCPECRAKFYDMGAIEVRCPKCDYVFPIHLTAREEPMATEVGAAPGIQPNAKHYKLSSGDEDDALGDFGEVIELEDFDDDFDDLDHLEEVEDHHEDPEVDVNGDDADDEMFIDEIGEADVHLIDEPDDGLDEREAL